MKEINPNLRTPLEHLSKNEHAKLASNWIRGNLPGDFRDTSVADLSWESEQLAKSHGIYLEWNRAKTGKEKEWMYMIRISIPGGGPITREQWMVLDELSERFTVNPEGSPSLRVTTRQNIQLHWVKKEHVIEVVRGVAESGFYSLNGCGDNVRNVMGCPASPFSKIYDANAWAQKAGRYFRLPTAAFIEIFGIDPHYLRDPEERFQYGPNLLNRKFKIGFSAIHLDEEKQTYVPDNCVELRTNDIGIAPIVEGDRVTKFQIYIGGSQGERNGKPTFSALGEPFGIARESELLKILDGIVQVHQEWGDRQNRHWARMKYVLLKQGMNWFRDQVRRVSGDDFEMPNPIHDYGSRHLHHGWMVQPSDGRLCYGAFIENGRIIDGPNGRLKAMVRCVMQKFPVQLMTTPNQDILFTNLPPEARSECEAYLKSFRYGMRHGRPYSRLRLLSGACVGRDTCQLTYTDAEKFEPFLVDELEQKWGEMAESIGVTGCERQCFRPATKTIGWVGMGLNRYQLKLGGTEDGKHQGEPLRDPETGEMYLRSVPRAEVAKVTDALFEFYVANRLSGEGMGYFHRRVGPAAIIRYLQSNPTTAELMKTTYKSPQSRKGDVHADDESTG
ncbi:MAG: nitrite/sulfite reductase [Candidatus Methylomirabilales bacterium]